MLWILYIHTRRLCKYIYIYIYIFIYTTSYRRCRLSVSATTLTTNCQLLTWHNEASENCGSRSSNSSLSFSSVWRRTSTAAAVPPPPPPPDACRTRHMRNLGISKYRMSVYVCVCVCVCVRVFVYVCVCLYAYACRCMCASMYVYGILNSVVVTRECSTLQGSVFRIFSPRMVRNFMWDFCLTCASYGQYVTWESGLKDWQNAFICRSFVYPLLAGITTAQVSARISSSSVLSSLSVSLSFAHSIYVYKAYIE